VIVDPEISLNIIQDEIKNCCSEAVSCGWLFSEIDRTNQSFTVTMISPIDQEKFILEVKFDNYKLWPLYLEFVHPLTGQKGVKQAYPKNEGSNHSFFHDNPCICHPCSRKAYKNYDGPHKEWVELAGWEKHPQTGSLTNLQGILRAIYGRISREDLYKGRKNG
jgi:hypothetical protein